MRAIFLILGFSLAVAAEAQFQTSFESQEGYNASANGVIVTGQQGWYQPASDSADGFVMSGISNRFGTVLHPNGGANWLTCAADETFPFIVSRAEHSVDFVNSEWTLTYDFNGQYLGQGAASDFLGGASLQPSLTANVFQTAFRWDNVNNPTRFTALYGVADSLGVPIGQQIATFLAPGPAWENLSVNHWYRSSTTWNFVTGKIKSVSIRDLTTGSSSTFVKPSEWYLAGGVLNYLGRPLPTALRFFAGGSSTGNVVSYDQVNAKVPLADSVLAPISERILLGSTMSGGDLDSWAEDDENPRTVCKFFMPTITTPFIRINLDYQMDPPELTSLKFRVKVASATPGPLALDLSMRSWTTGRWTLTSVTNSPIVNGRVYEATPTGSLNQYVDSTGRLSAEIGIWQRGPSTSFYPCVTFEYANLEVQH